MCLFHMATTTTTTFCLFADKSNATLLSRDSGSAVSRRGVEFDRQYHTNLDSYDARHVFNTFFIESHNVSMTAMFSLQLRLSRFLLWNLVHIWMTLFRNSRATQYCENKISLAKGIGSDSFRMEILTGLIRVVYKKNKYCTFFFRKSIKNLKQLHTHTHTKKGFLREIKICFFFSESTKSNLFSCILTY